MDQLPPSTLFGGSPAAEPTARNHRSDTQIGRNPFAPSPHGAAMLEASAMLAPLVMVWDYRVADAAGFCGWLATKDILLKPARMAKDPRLAGVRYSGTYQVMGRHADGDLGAGGQFRTYWGYTDNAAMESMHALCSGQYETATIAQIDLMEIVGGIKRAIATAGDQHFSQEVLVSTPAVLVS